MLLGNPSTKKAEVFYQKGMAAEKAGDPSAAASAYAFALKLYPGHANARYRAGQVRLKASSIQSSGIQQKIGAVPIAVYQVEHTPMHEAIELLSKAIEKSTDGKIAPNFVIQDPHGQLAAKKITLLLRNIPAKAILESIHQQTRTKARYDEHAVVISSL